jgi:hypothetical protein
MKSLGLVCSFFHEHVSYFFRYVLLQAEYCITYYAFMCISFVIHTDRPVEVCNDFVCITIICLGQCISVPCNSGAI